MRRERDRGVGDRKGMKKAGRNQSALFTLNVGYKMETKTTGTKKRFQLSAPSAACSLGGHKLLLYSSVPCLISIFGSTTIQLDSHFLTIDSRLEMAFAAGPRIPRPGSL